MAVSLFEILEGLRISNQADTSTAEVLQGIGAPTMDAPIGSIFMRTDASVPDNLQLYYKWQAGSGALAWRPVASKDYVDAVISGTSWREPVKVLDTTTYANIAAAETAANVADTVNGVGISAADRILFSDLTTGNDNVYVVSGSSGNWTFTEDTNTATDGDALLVQEGTNAEQQWLFDGTVWVQISSTSGTLELQYIRNFIGKSASGSIMPTYTSTNVVTQNGSLQSAVGELDAVFGDGNITTTGGNWAVTSDGTWAPSPGTNDVTGLVDDLNVAIGDRSYTNTGLLPTSLVDGESVATSIEKLNVAVIDLTTQSNISTGTNTTSVNADLIPLTDVTEVKWLVQVRSNLVPANRRAYEVHAITDGTVVDFNQFSALKLGAGITITLNVAIVGSDLALQLSSATAFDYVVQRVGYSSF